MRSAWKSIAWVFFQVTLEYSISTAFPFLLAKDHYNNNIRHGKAAFNQYSVLPPISTRTNPIINGSRAENQQEVKRPSPEPSIQQMKSPPKPPVRSDDIYLPNEPVLLTDYEEQRLADQIRVQLTSPTIIDRLKIFYQELTAYDPERANSVHYSTIQQMANQLGVSKHSGLANGTHFDFMKF